MFDAGQQKFLLQCKPAAIPRSSAPFQVPYIENFTKYMYDTGTGFLFKKYITNLGTLNFVPQSKTRNFSVLLKREGEGNPWHCMLEILSLTLSFDVLRMARNSMDNDPIFTEADIANTQIVVLDNRLDGPYWDLWRLFANKPILRLSNLTEATPIDNIIVPLAGGSNPIWQGDWEVQSCGTSSLLRTFVTRVLSFYRVETPSPNSAITVTFIDRHEGRRLVNQTRLLALASTIPHVRIHSVDFTPLSFPDQIRAVRDADVLVGVHGAGLTHAMWLHPGAAVAEILPHGLAHKGFRNLAQLLGLGYFSLHAAEEEVPGKGGRRVKRDKWHTHDVFVEEDRWLRLIRAAVADVYNKGDRNFDVA
jgi:hypothetical protein